MFEPTTFPSAMLVFFFNAAAIEAASSGSDVPQAINVSDMKASFTPNDFAITTALSTNMSQLYTSTARPPNTLSTAIHIGPVSSVF